jgi:cytochrome bd-type quinol oxidase subunit 2
VNEELLKRLDVLAAKLGVTAQYLWTVLVKQAHIEAAMDTFWAVVFIALLVSGVICLRWSIKKINDPDTYNEEGWIALSTFSGIVIFAGLILVPVFTSSAIAEHFNPEYWALEKILSALK